MNSYSIGTRPTITSEARMMIPAADWLERLENVYHIMTRLI